VRNTGSAAVPEPVSVPGTRTGIGPGGIGERDFETVTAVVVGEGFHDAVVGGPYQRRLIRGHKNAVVLKKDDQPVRGPTGAESGKFLPDPAGQPATGIAVVDEKGVGKEPGAGFPTPPSAGQTVHQGGVSMHDETGGNRIVQGSFDRRPPGRSGQNGPGQDPAGRLFAIRRFGGQVRAVEVGQAGPLETDEIARFESGQSPPRRFDPENPVFFDRGVAPPAVDVTGCAELARKCGKL